MKRAVMCVVAFGSLVIGFAAVNFDRSPWHAQAQTIDPAQIKIPEVIVLGKDAKLGQIMFNHVSHNSGKYSIDGTGPIACIECHHAARPAAEIVKHPPLKTAWPADRTTTLTLELFKKDPASAGVAACRSCHSRVGEIPKLLPAIPEIKHESSTAMITLTNQQAFHRNCVGCHTEAKKTAPAMKAPSAMQCIMCHKKSA